MTVHRMMGIETEYGVLEPGFPMANPMALSAAVVAGYAQSVATARWDYEGEDPLADARGFRLDRAAAHPDQLTDSPADLAARAPSRPRRCRRSCRQVSHSEPAARRQARPRTDVRIE